MPIGKLSISATAEEMAASRAEDGPSDGNPSPTPQPPVASGGLVVLLPTAGVPKGQGSAAADAVERMIDRNTQAALGRQLRQHFNEIAAEPLPERLLRLLRQLEKRQKESGT